MYEQVPEYADLVDVGGVITVFSYVGMPRNMAGANPQLFTDKVLPPLGILHRETADPLFIGNACLFDPFGLHLRELRPRSTLLTKRGLPESEWDAIAHHTIVYVLLSTSTDLDGLGGVFDHAS